MSFDFGGISVASKKQVLKLNKIKSCILADKTFGEGQPVAIIADQYYDPNVVPYIEDFLRKSKIYNYIILCPIKYDISKEDIKKEQKDKVTEFYINNVSNFRDYIPKNSPIIVSGPGIYSLLQEDDINCTHVQQRIFDVPHFWFSYDLSSNGNWIYPIESFTDIFADGFNKGPIDSYRTKLAQIQFNDVIKTGFKAPPRIPRLKKNFITSKEEFYSVFYEPNKNRKNDLMCWDLETSGLNFLTNEIGCITISFDGIEGYYIPWKYIDKEKLNEIFRNNRQLGHNLSFDVKHAWREGLPDARIDEDTFLIAHTLDETRSNSLKAMAFYYSEFGGYERALDNYKKKYNISNYLNIDEDILKEYAIMDAIVCRRIYDRMISHMRLLDLKYPNPRFENNTLEEYYSYRRIPAVNMYTKLEYRGIYIRKDKLDALRKDMQKAIDELKDKLTKAFDTKKDFNWSSSEQVGKLLEKKGWEDWGRNEKGIYNVAAFQLDRWKKNHPEAYDLDQLGSYETLISSFVGDEAGTKGWSQYLYHHDEDPENVWRMHPNFLAMGTESGRTRCRNPNMQNVPTRGKFTKEIKACLCTPNDEEYYMVTIDFSALQLRLASIDCGDEILEKVFTSKNADVHSQTGYNVFAMNKEIDVEIITVEDEKGKIHEFLGGELVETKRGEVFAKDLREDDEIVW